MKIKRNSIITLATVLVLLSCKKDRNPQRPEQNGEIQVLAFTQGSGADYENHFLWSKTKVKSFQKLNVDQHKAVDAGFVDGEDIYIAQNGCFWKNTSKVTQFETIGVTTNVAYRLYNHNLVTLVRKPTENQTGLFDYSIMEGSSTLFTVTSDDQTRYEFKDFLKIGNAYYLLGYVTTAQTSPIIFKRENGATSTIGLNTDPAKNFQPAKFILAGTKFYCLGYVNNNGTLQPAVLSLETNGQNKDLRQLNLAANTVLYDILVDGPNLYVSGWETRDNSGSYFAFYLRNDQKIPLSNKQSRAMQLLKHNDAIYIAGLEWEPSLSYKIWKNEEEYAVLKTESGKPLIPLQLFAE